MSDFVIRVYGLVLHRQHLLVVDEIIKGEEYTKFPGGGLEFGEGTRDCLKRELKEECNLEVEVGEHFYTTDFFQQSQFHKRPLQVVSIYYLVNLDESVSQPLLSATPNEDSIIRFRWLPIKDITQNDLSLPIDKVVVGMVKESL
jgi:ADP-ribose pyrophosphatase YjhB (NUDIX family)